MDATQSMIAPRVARRARRGAVLQVAFLPGKALRLLPRGGGNHRLEREPQVLETYCMTVFCPRSRAQARARRGGGGTDEGICGYQRAAMFRVPPVTAPSRSENGSARSENGSAGSVSAPDAAPAPPLEKKKSTPPPEDRKVAKAMTQLNRTCDELIETESTYVSMLETIVDVYLVPLRTWAQEDASKSTSANKVDSITPAEVERLFGSVETLLNINRELLDKLRTTTPDPLLVPNDPAARAAGLAKTLATAAAGPLRFCDRSPLEPALAILQMG